jgi:hypothetical protein
MYYAANIANDVQDNHLFWGSVEINKFLFIEPGGICHYGCPLDGWFVKLRKFGRNKLHNNNITKNNNKNN